MEINNINQINDLSTLAGSINSNSISQQKVENHTNNNSNSYSINPDILSKRSNISKNLNNFITSISVAQTELHSLNIQNKILDNMKDITNSVNMQNSESNDANTIQTDIASLITQYNSQSSLQGIEQTDSESYFDGALGANPISVNEIINEVEEKRDVIKQRIKSTTKEIEQIETKAINIIDEEVAKTQSQKPFKNIDFGKSMNDFSSASINNLIGSVALSQANAIPTQAQKLLF